MNITDPNTIYTMTIVDSMANGGAVAEEFERARDNPRYSKVTLMACVLAGWFAATRLIGVPPTDT